MIDSTLISENKTFDTITKVYSCYFEYNYTKYMAIVHVLIHNDSIVKVECDYLYTVIIKNDQVDMTLTTNDDVVEYLKNYYTRDH